MEKTNTHSHGIDRTTQKRVLWIALLANAGYLLVEAVGGILFNSLALLADAGHMLSDVAGLAIALFSQRLLDRPPSEKHSYGFQRAEVLGALLNAVLLLAVVVWVVIEALHRFSNPQTIEGGGLLVVAVIGLAVNLGSAILLARNTGHSLNMRGAFIHMAADAAGSVGVIIAAIAVLAFGASRVDPAVSILISGLILWSTWGLLRDAVHVLLEGTPKNLGAAAVKQTLSEVKGVESVHHLHIWNLASDTPALSAHVVMGEKLGLHEAQERGKALKQLLADRFGIEHATLEVECHDCQVTVGPPEVP